MTAEPILPTHRTPRPNRYTRPQARFSGLPVTNGDEQAACATRTDLPWVPEPAANLRQQWEMRAICNTCPLIRACAKHAAETMPVGFYAGTWIPGMGRGRPQAFKTLRIIANRTETL